MPLKAPAPALSTSRHAIENAFLDLERTISPAESRDFSSTTLGDVRRAAIDLERQLAARQSLRNMRRLEPLFQGLGHYSKVIDTLCNGTDYLAWIWAPIKLILKISSDYLEAFDRIIKAYSQIAESLGRFQLLEMSFKGKPELYPVFVVFYADILRFHKAAYKFITRRSWKILFMTSWGRFEREFGAILEDLKRHGELIDKETNAHNIMEARATREMLKSWRQDNLEHLAREQKQHTARQMQGIIAWLRLDDSDQIVLLDMLAKVGETHPGTVDWIIKRPQVASWLRSGAEKPFLWLQGAPGTGKSVIVARLVSFLGLSRKSLVIQHFCSYTHASSTQYEHIIKSLLLQAAQKDPDLVAFIYEEHVGTQQATIQCLEKLLEIAVELLCGNGEEGIYVLLDGLDECSNDKQRRLIRLMERLTLAGSSCKVLISSRDTLAFRDRLKKKVVLSLSDEKESLRDAIARYSYLRLRKMNNRLQELGISDDESHHIASHIGERADGMFLWACLMLNYLGANFFYSHEEFMSAVNTLPHELSAFYEKLLSRILSDLDTRSALRLRAIFGWIAFARRPLRKAELQSALVFQADGPRATRSVPPHILEACKPLIEERRDSTLAFIHISVKDFLQSDICNRSVRMQEDLIRWDQGLASIRCVRAAFETFNPLFPERELKLEVIRGVWGFVSYATEFWGLELQEMVGTMADRQDPRFAATCSELSALLSTSQSSPDMTTLGTPPEALDPIRVPLPSLWYEAATSLQARSAGRHRFGDSPSTDTLLDPTRIHHVFLNYETTIRCLVKSHDHCGTTSSEFEQFCDNFGRHAYLCRFVACIYATSGFNTDEERKAHETGHTFHFPCPEAMCQYPPFGSNRALKRHLIDKHEKGSKRRPKIRPMFEAKPGDRGWWDFDGLRFANPLLSGDVLTDFDFDSFLHESNDKDGEFDVNVTTQVLIGTVEDPLTSAGFGGQDPLVKDAANQFGPREGRTRGPGRKSSGPQVQHTSI